MCIATTNPTGFSATSSLITQSLGAVTDAAGAYASAASEKMSQRMQAYFARLNAEAEADNAREVLRQGEFAQTQQMLETAQLKSRQRAAMGANNVDMSEGSALDRLTTTDYLGEVDRNTIAANAAREAAGHRTRASAYRMDATMREAAARSISPLTVGLTTLATGAGKVGSDWYKLDQAGAWGGRSAEVPRSTFDLNPASFSGIPQAANRSLYRVGR